jgi:hypothetical protein
MTLPRAWGHYEHRSDPLLTRAQFRRRLQQHGLLALALIFGSLGVGVLGYRLIEGLSWIDSLLNASMLLGGMGEVSELHTTGGKLFASGFAIYSGLLVLAVAGLIAAPIAHRILHRLHLATRESEPKPPAAVSPPAPAPRRAGPG